MDNPVSVELLNKFKEFEHEFVQKALKTAEEEVEVEDIGTGKRYKFVVLPTVFHPGIFKCGIPEKVNLLPIEKGKRMLDLGTGCGVCAVMAAKRGMIVWASDVNPEAVECTKINAKKHGVDIKVIESDVFESVVFDNMDEKEKFDLIWWHHPYGRSSGKEEYGDYKLNLLDEGYQHLGRYFKGAKERLKKGGVICVPNGAQLGDRDLFFQRAKEAGLQWKIRGTIDGGESSLLKGIRFSTEVFELTPK